MTTLPKVCLIGAGSSGITVIKALKDAGIPFDCFEKSDQIGGNWTFRNKNNMSAAYESLHINTSRDRMSYRDWPMSSDYPDYPGHGAIKRYFDNYVDKFGLRELITFETAVEHVSRDNDGVWQVKLSNGETRFYDAMIVANGHHWDPRWPDPPFPGHFDGIEIHSHSYINPSEPVDMHGKRIVVLGMGNSAMDIACELCRPGIAERLYLAARRGAWVLPKYLFGKPLDTIAAINPYVPTTLANRLVRLLLRLNIGKPEDYGLPRPRHKLFSAHPTISQDIFVRLGSGDILPKPNIAELKGDRVRFEDGSDEAVDVIVYCTGYNVRFPFFDQDFLDAPDNELPLWHRMIKPGIPDLFFVGLLQPLGAIMPLAEAQGKFIAAHLKGEIRLPDDTVMEKEMQRERVAVAKRYVASPRHTMQVDFARYLLELGKAERKGRRRAERAGNRLPVPSKLGPTGRQAAAE